MAALRTARAAAPWRGVDGSLRDENRHCEVAEDLALLVRLAVEVLEANEGARALAVVAVVERAERNEAVDRPRLENIFVRLEAKRGAHCNV